MTNNNITQFLLWKKMLSLIPQHMVDFDNGTFSAWLMQIRKIHYLHVPTV